MKRVLVFAALLALAACSNLRTKPAAMNGGTVLKAAPASSLPLTAVGISSADLKTWPLVNPQVIGKPLLLAYWAGHRATTRRF